MIFDFPENRFYLFTLDTFLKSLLQNIFLKFFYSEIVIFDFLKLVFTKMEEFRNFED